MSQKTLCEKTRLAQRFVSGVERGHVDPRLTVLWKIAQALEVSLSVLLHDVDDVEIERKPAALATVEATD
jgi:transcriptional regulator with XRE-family HTH domain